MQNPCTFDTFLWPKLKKKKQNTFKVNAKEFFSQTTHCFPLHRIFKCEFLIPHLFGHSYCHSLFKWIQPYFFSLCSSLKLIIHARKFSLCIFIYFLCVCHFIPLGNLKYAQAFSEISGIITMFYVVRALSPYTEYEFYVIAVNNIGRGPPSIPATTTTGETGKSFNNTNHHELGFAIFFNWFI